MDKLLTLFPTHYKQFFLRKPNLKFNNLIKSHLLPTFTSSYNISLLSYNILASGYTSQSVYYYVNPDYLIDEHRLNMITYDLMSSDSDIICLQEVEKKTYDSHISKRLDGYEGVYSKRVGLNCDGLAIMYKKELFNKVDFYTIDLNNITSISNLNIPIFLKNMMKTNNIAQILILEHKSKPINTMADYIIVVNLHLFWDPSKEIIKYLQMSQIINRVHSLREEIKLDDKYDYKSKNPVFICGDFNSMPNSNVINLLKNPTVSANPIDDNKYFKDINI